MDSCAIKQISTAESSLQFSKQLNLTKIIGYYPQKDQLNLNLIPLTDVLPIEINLLDFIMTNLICNILEIIKRELETPNISLDQIMVIKNNHNCGIPFIFSKQDKTNAKQCEHKLLKQFSFLCEQLGYDDEFVNSTSLKHFQDRLLLRINFQYDALEQNTATLLEYLKIFQNFPIHKNQFTHIYPIEFPKFLIKEKYEEQIVVKIQKIVKEEFYELREISIIEDFNNTHLPYLYGYLRYNEILMLFLKKHDYSFNFISKKIFKIKQKLNPEKLSQFFYKLYRSMIKAVNYIHSMDIIHRDLKPDNIMFDLVQPSTVVVDFLNTPFNCVLIDFDRSITSEQIQPQNQSNYEGTQFYRPPEGVQNNYNSSYDIWQLGFMWLVMQKSFMYEREESKNTAQQNFYKNIESQQTQIQQENEKIADLKNKTFDNFALKFQRQQHLDKKKKLYQDLIQQIEKKENFINYDVSLQNLIQKMIELEPNNRANISEIFKILDKIIE
ncbi:unnamed protein product [Paramecium sonneborni]|uniref:Protein kinase domain-containing protein n=1 Tax=Paramecium sonneborni TaxID=65129 RepID=A0A8S1PJ84_9CILI|nr:unnamed protein product [Paramecium sonneborni]